MKREQMECYLPSAVFPDRITFWADATSHWFLRARQDLRNGRSIYSPEVAHKAAAYLNAKAGLRSAVLDAES